MMSRCIDPDFLPFTLCPFFVQLYPFPVQMLGGVTHTEGFPYSGVPYRDHTVTPPYSKALHTRDSIQGTTTLLEGRAPYSNLHHTGHLQGSHPPCLTTTIPWGSTSKTVTLQSVRILRSCIIYNEIKCWKSFLRKAFAVDFISQEQHASWECN